MRRENWWLAGIAVALAALMILVMVTLPEERPAYATHNTDPEGCQGVATLLGRLGFTLRPATGAQAPAGPAALWIAGDGGPTSSPAAVNRWVAQGGVLILAGGWRAYRAASLTDGQSAAHFEALPEAEPADGRAVPVGQGSIVYLSDADRFTNAQAGQGDNAAALVRVLWPYRAEPLTVIEGAWIVPEAPATWVDRVGGAVGLFGAQLCVAVAAAFLLIRRLTPARPAQGPQPQEVESVAALGRAMAHAHLGADAARCCYDHLITRAAARLNAPPGQVLEAWRRAGLPGAEALARARAELDRPGWNRKRLMRYARSLDELEKELNRL